MDHHQYRFNRYSLFQKINFWTLQNFIFILSIFKVLWISDIIHNQETAPRSEPSKRGTCFQIMTGWKSSNMNLLIRNKLLWFVISRCCLRKIIDTIVIIYTKIIGIWPPGYPQQFKNLRCWTAKKGTKISQGVGD